MGICRFCGQEKKLIKSHIIPEKFYTSLNEGVYRIIASNNYPSRSPSGVYDMTILCDEHDRDLGVYDDEAITLLLKNINDYEVSSVFMKERGERLFLIPKDKFNYDRLRKFFISLIWRASITRNASFNKVNLGKYEEIALKILKGETKDNIDLFSTIIFKTDPKLSSSKSMFVESKKIDYTRFYEFYCAGYCIVVFVDFSKLQKNEDLQRLDYFRLKPNYDINIVQTKDDILEGQALYNTVVTRHLQFMKNVKGVMKPL